MSETHACGKSKVEVYDWKPLDEPGVQGMIHKNLIDVDHTYQRDESVAKSRKIAAEFQWRLFGVVSVTDRGCGRFWAFDGQHRLGGAKRRDDIVEVPCIIFRVSSDLVEAREEESKLFVDANGTRTSVAAHARHKAALNYRDPASMRVQSLLDSDGRQLVHCNSNSEMKVARCARLLVKWSTKNGDLLTRMYPLMSKICGDGPLHEIVVDSLLWVETNLRDDSLLAQRWSTKLLAAGSALIVTEARREAALYGHSGAAVWGRAIVKMLNKGMRNKLMLRETTEGAP